MPNKEIYSLLTNINIDNTNKKNKIKNTKKKIITECIIDDD